MHLFEWRQAQYLLKQYSMAISGVPFADRVTVFQGGRGMLIDRIPCKSIFPFAAVMLLVLITNGSAAGEAARQIDSKHFLPDPAEYHAISDEEAFELSVAEDEYEPSPIEESPLFEEDFLPQTGSTVTFCNEADCNSVTVVFGGVSHPAYLSCYGNILFYNIPAGPIDGRQLVVAVYRRAIYMSMV
jgi:hypothetical protein